MLTEITRSNLQQVENITLAHLKALADRLGVDFSFAGGNYGPGEATLKLKISVRKMADGSSGAQKTWNVFCGHFGFTPSDFGRRFHSRGIQYEITGINPNAPKYAVMTIRVHDRKPFRFPHQLVRLRLLPAKTAVAA